MRLRATGAFVVHRCGFSQKLRRAVWRINPHPHQRFQEWSLEMGLRDGAAFRARKSRDVSLAAPLQHLGAPRPPEKRGQFRPRPKARLLIGNDKKSGAPQRTKMGTQIIGEYRFSAVDNGPTVYGKGMRRERLNALSGPPRPKARVDIVLARIERCKGCDRMP